MNKKMISISIKDVHQMRKLFIAADDNVLFYEHKFSQSLLRMGDVIEAFNDEHFTGYELRYWPDTEYMQLVENYSAKDSDTKWNEVSTAYSCEQGKIKQLFNKVLDIINE